MKTGSGSRMSKQEKPRAFYGAEKDGTPLRNDISIRTNGLHICEKCAEKTLTIRFRENEGANVTPGS